MVRYHLALVLLVGVLGACGDDDEDEAAPTTTTTAPPACELSGADVSAIIGVGFADPTETVSAVQVQCIYEVIEDGEAGLVIVRHAFTDAAGEEETFRAVTSDEIEVDAGDAGWWSATTGTLFARTGDESVEVLLSSFLHQPELPGSLVELAVAVLAA